jgi:luciferase family oxidoreductase group 1
VPPLSVLDLVPIASGSTPSRALAASTALARRTEELGYRRYWVAEHHGMPGIASSAPAVLIAHLAAATSTIRVGSGGVMLPNHQPLVVAEQFGTLDALHPGRIDLGIGRAPGTDPRTAAALRRGTDPLGAEDFPRQLAELAAYFRGEGPVTAVPAHGQRPALWLLGSSGYSAQLAGCWACRSRSRTTSPAGTPWPRLTRYREAFRPSPVLERPYAVVCASVLVAADDDEARWLAAPAALQFLRLRQGEPGPLPTPEEAGGAPVQPPGARVRGGPAGRAGDRRPGRGAGRGGRAGRAHGRRRADGRHEHPRQRRPGALLRAPRHRRRGRRPGLSAAGLPRPPRSSNMCS